MSSSVAELESVRFSSKLVYRLIEGPISLEPMVVLDSRALPWNTWQVSFYILGSSHAMGLKSGSREITELLSCAPAFHNSGTIIDVATEEDHFLSASSFDLAFSVELKRGPLFAIAPYAGRRKQSDWLEYAYSNSDIDAPSWTQLSWHFCDQELRLETVHTYPHEGVSVHSLTKVVEKNHSVRENAHGR